MGSKILKENRELRERLNKVRKELYKNRVDYEFQLDHMERLIELNSLLKMNIDLEEILLSFFGYMAEIFCFDKALFSFEKNNKEYEYEFEKLDDNLILNEIDKMQYSHLEKYFDHMKKIKKEIVCKNSSHFINLKNHNISAFIGVPIIYNDEVNGKIFLLSKKEHNFHKKEGKIISDFLIFVMSSIENAIIFNELNELSIKDCLTGVYNRRYFFEYAEKEFLKSRRDKRKLAIVMADIDSFKEVNDSKGHQIGDLVLQDVSKILKDSMRETDIVARYGGEEFILLFSETEEEESCLIVERMRARIKEKKIKSIDVTLSFGIAVYSGEENIKTINDLVERADKAMYYAKKKGKDRVMLYDESIIED